jgi:hypothetical protein
MLTISLLWRSAREMRPRQPVDGAGAFLQVLQRAWNRSGKDCCRRSSLHLAVTERRDRQTDLLLIRPLPRALTGKNQPFGLGHGAKAAPGTSILCSIASFCWHSQSL